MVPDDLTGGRAQAVMEAAVNTDQAFLAGRFSPPVVQPCPLTVRPNRPWTGTGLWPRGWGPLP